jgi:hypothetical protein
MSNFLHFFVFYSGTKFYEDVESLKSRQKLLTLPDMTPTSIKARAIFGNFPELVSKKNKTMKSLMLKNLK